MLALTELFCKLLASRAALYMRSHRHDNPEVWNPGLETPAAPVSQERGSRRGEDGVPEPSPVRPAPVSSSGRWEGHQKTSYGHGRQVSEPLPMFLCAGSGAETETGGRRAALTAVPGPWGAEREQVPLRRVTFDDRRRDLCLEMLS